jgi:phosphatidylserine/phosphatidylglycerophosphate/cardiolipin synthase-like enzyme
MAAMQSILQPGRTVWTVERAHRAAVLVDGASFFAAVRAACLKARRTIFIVGWDIDSRTELVGMGPGLAALALMGNRIVRVLSNPHPGQIAVLALCVAGWIGLSFGAQALVSQRDGRAP